MFSSIDKDKVKNLRPFLSYNKFFVATLCWKTDAESTKTNKTNKTFIRNSSVSLCYWMFNLRPELLSAHLFYMMGKANAWLLNSINVYGIQSL